MNETISWALKAPTSDRRNAILLDHLQMHVKQVSSQDAITLAYNSSNTDTRNKILSFFVENNLQIEPNEVKEIAPYISTSEVKNHTLQTYVRANFPRLSASQVLELAQTTTNSDSRNSILLNYVQSTTRKPISTDEVITLAVNAASSEYRNEILKNHFYSTPKLTQSDFDKLHDNCSNTAARTELYDAMTERRNPVTVYINSDHLGPLEYIEGIRTNFHSTVISQNLARLKERFFKFSPNILDVEAFADLIRNSGTNEQCQQFEIEAMKSYWPHPTLKHPMPYSRAKSLTVQKWLELSKLTDNPPSMVQALRESSFYVKNPAGLRKLLPLFIWEEQTFWASPDLNLSQQDKLIIQSAPTSNITMNHQIALSNSEFDITKFEFTVDRVENLAAAAHLELSKIRTKQLNTNQVISLSNSTPPPFHDEILTYFAKENAERLKYEDTLELARAASETEAKRSIIQDIFLGNPELKNHITQDQIISLAATAPKGSPLHDEILLDYTKQNINRLTLEDILRLAKTTSRNESNGIIIQEFLKDETKLGMEDLEKLAEASRSETVNFQISEMISKIEQKAVSWIKAQHPSLTVLLSSLLTDFPNKLLKRHLDTLKNRVFTDFSSIEDLNRFRDFFEKVYGKGTELDLFDQEVLVRFSELPRLNEYSFFSPTNTTQESWFSFLKLVNGNQRLEKLLLKFKPPFFVRRSDGVHSVMPITITRYSVLVIDHRSNTETRFPRKISILSLSFDQIQTDPTRAPQLSDYKGFDITIYSMTPRHVEERIQLVMNYLDEKWNEITETPSFSDQRFSLEFKTGLPLLKRKHNIPIILLSIDNRDPKKATARVMIGEQFEAAATIRNEVEVFEVPLSFLRFSATTISESSPKIESTTTLLKPYKKGQLLISTQSRIDMSNGINPVNPEYAALAKLLHERKVLATPISNPKPTSSQGSQTCNFIFQGCDI